MTTDRPLLSVSGLEKSFLLGAGPFSRPLEIKALAGVSFDLEAGETLGIVGESGCGKSTLGRSILRLIEPTRGHVRLEGVDVMALDAEALRRRRRDMQLIFQDPVASLDPRMTIGDIIAEPLRVFEPGLARGERVRRVIAIMDRVGLAPEMLNRYPHEFSGGQAQRIGIARAIVSRPKLVVCDEPVSALDVSIQAQIINLLVELRRNLNLTMLFISHDLSVVRHIANRVLVLYLGRVVELAERSVLFERPRHPYTRALLSSALVADPKVARARPLAAMAGEIPSAVSLPSGCAFRTRCPYVRERCAAERPALRDVGDGTEVACHFAEDLSGT